MITGDDVPKICARCADSHWEEMCSGYEEPYCSMYNMRCPEALEICERISLNKCKDCPRYS